MEVINLDDTVKTDDLDDTVKTAAEEKPIVHLFENFKIIYVLTLRLSSNFDDLKHQNVIVLSIFRILKQVPETTEEVRQRTLRQAAAAKAPEESGMGRWADYDTDDEPDIPARSSTNVAPPPPPANKVEDRWGSIRDQQGQSRLSQPDVGKGKGKGGKGMDAKGAKGEKGGKKGGKSFDERDDPWSRNSNGKAGKDDGKGGKGDGKNNAAAADDMPAFKATVIRRGGWRDRLKEKESGAPTPSRTDSPKKNGPADATAGAEGAAGKYFVSKT